MGTLTDDFFAKHLAGLPVIAILRGLSPRETVAAAERCWDAGVELVEVPTQGSEGLAALDAAVSAAKRRDWFVGAGTVYRTEDAERAREVGARFLVAPGLDAETVATTRRWQMPYLPGVVSPSEVQLALSLGVHTVKLFPAVSLGPSWISSMRGPFPDLNFVAVGGVNPANAQAFLDAGALAVGIGSALGSAGAVTSLLHLRRGPTPVSTFTAPDEGGLLR